MSAYDKLESALQRSGNASARLNAKTTLRQSPRSSSMWRWATRRESRCTRWRRRSSGTPA
eukprot:3080504-Prymnesium_polylepis.1